MQNIKNILTTHTRHRNPPHNAATHIKNSNNKPKAAIITAAASHIQTFSANANTVSV